MKTILLSALLYFTAITLVDARPPAVMASPMITVLDLAFGVVPASQGSRTLGLPIRNDGGDTLVITAIDIDDSTAFRLTTPLMLPIMLGSGEEVSVDITFEPLAPGAYAATVRVASNTTGGRSIASVGGIADGDAISATNHSFGTVAVERDSGRVGIVSILNEGRQPVELHGIASTSGDTAMFRILTPGVVEERSLAPGESVAVLVHYTPTDAGDHRMVITWRTEPSTDATSVLTGRATMISGIRDAEIAPTAAVIESIAPNPAVGSHVHVRLAPSVLERRLELIDVDGARLRGWTIPRADTEIALDVTGIPAGTYLLRSTAGNATSTRTLVVVH